MKKLTLFALTISLMGCTSHNEDKVFTWVKQATKPVVCREYGRTGFGDVVYTLIDAKGSIYSTGNVILSLPDTIK